MKNQERINSIRSRMKQRAANDLQRTHKYNDNLLAETPSASINIEMLKKEAGNVRTDGAAVLLQSSQC